MHQSWKNDFLQTEGTLGRCAAAHIFSLRTLGAASSYQQNQLGSIRDHVCCLLRFACTGESVSYIILGQKKNKDFKSSVVKEHH